MIHVCFYFLGQVKKSVFLSLLNFMSILNKIYLYLYELILLFEESSTTFFSKEVFFPCCEVKYTQRFASSSHFCPWRRKREPFRPVAWPHRDKTHMLQLGGRKKVGQRKKQTLQEGMKSKIKESEVL